MEYKLKVNGFDIIAEYNDDDIENVFLPIIKNLIDLQKQKNKRVIMFLVAPPGSGKSTLVKFLSMVSNEYYHTKIQTIGIDGFHYYQEYLNNHSININGEDVVLKTIKGNEQTFDVEKLRCCLGEMQSSDVYWPDYSRLIHDPVENAIFVNENIIIIEGNYLLLKDTKWGKLKEFCDYSVMLEVEKDILRKRLIDRKIKGGYSEKEATDWFANVDKKNIDTVLNNSYSADCKLYYDGKKYSLVK